MRVPRLPPYPWRSTSERFVGDSVGKGMAAQLNRRIRSFVMPRRRGEVEGPRMAPDGQSWCRRQLAYLRALARTWALQNF